jgi:hypothetical protein
MLILLTLLKIICALLAIFITWHVIGIMSDRRKERLNEIKFIDELVEHKEKDLEKM